MALFLTARINGDVQLRACHIGTKIHGDVVEHIIRVEADGTELEYIRNNFTGIPITKNQRIVKWFGEDAKFIAGNFSR